MEVIFNVSIKTPRIQQSKSSCLVSPYIFHWGSILFFIHETSTLGCNRDALVPPMCASSIHPCDESKHNAIGGVVFVELFTCVVGVRELWPCAVGTNEIAPATAFCSASNAQYSASRSSLQRARCSLSLRPIQSLSVRWFVRTFARGLSFRSIAISFILFKSFALDTIARPR